MRSEPAPEPLDTQLQPAETRLTAPVLHGPRDRGEEAISLVGRKEEGTPPPSWEPLFPDYSWVWCKCLSGLHMWTVSPKAKLMSKLKNWGVLCVHMFC